MLKLNVGRITLSAGTAGEIVPSRTGRKELRLENVGGTGSDAIGIGPTSGVTISTSYKPNSLPPLLDMEDSVWGIYTGSPSTKIVQFLEIYDDEV